MPEETILKTYCDKMLQALKNLLDPQYGDSLGILAEREGRELIREIENRNNDTI